MSVDFVAPQNIVENRYEEKALCKALWPDLSVWIHSETGIYFHKQFEFRRVNSLYFDSFDLDNLVDNLSGSPRRMKTRLRWYGNSWEMNNPRFEVKIKMGSITQKKIYSLDSFSQNLNEVSSLRRLSDFVQKKLPQAARIFLEKNSCPTLFVTYERHYFEEEDRQLRLTLDRDIRVAGLWNMIRMPMITHRLFPWADEGVLELKYPSSKLKMAEKFWGALPLKRDRMSKYVAGMIKTYENY